LLLITAQGRDRLDVFQAADARPVVGWRPAPGKAITWAEFLADDRVLTMDTAGTLALWSLPDAKPLYVAEGIGAQGRPVLSPGRAVLVVFGDTQARFLDPTNGTALGSAGLPSLDPVTAAAFRSDGGELAAICGTELLRWDLTRKGASLPSAPAPLTQKTERLLYVDKDHLLLGDHWLFNLPNGRVSWVFKNGMVSPTSPDGALWYAASTQNIGQSFLKAIDLPGKEVTDAEAAAYTPNAKAVLGPGSTIGVEVQGGPPRDQDNFRKQLVSVLDRRLKGYGITAHDAKEGATPRRLIAKFSERDIPNATVELHIHKPGASQPEKRTFPAKAIDWDVSLTDGAGPPIGLAKHKGGMWGFGFLNIPPGEADLEGMVKLRMYEAIRDQGIAAVDLPYFVMRRPGGGNPLIVPGTTDLGHLTTTFDTITPTYRPVATPPGP
jgi:hypothetical protein